MVVYKCKKGFSVEDREVKYIEEGTLWEHTNEVSLGIGDIHLEKVEGGKGNGKWVEITEYNLNKYFKKQGE